jgi:NitT/TauT family transport system substrate-binding protein
MKVAGSATGSASTSTMNEALKKAGLRPSDVERVFLSFPQHIIALENKAVDAVLTTEPSATEAVRRGVAVRIMGNDEFYPNHQLAVVLYSAEFTGEQPGAAKAFMRAYIHALRDYNDALANGKLAGPAADEVISILTEYTPIKDASVYRAIIPQGIIQTASSTPPALKSISNTSRGRSRTGKRNCRPNPRRVLRRCSSQGTGPVSTKK